MPKESGNQESRVEAVMTNIDDDVLSNAREAGVNVEGVVQGTIDDYSDYSPKTQSRFATSALNNQIEASGAEEMTGILCGSRDRSGKNWPRRYALVRSNGDHIEASSWDSSVQTTDGGEVTIPAGAVVKVGVEHDPEYDSYELAYLDSSQQLSHEELSERLSSVARPPSELSGNDEWSTVCVRGTIAYVNPQTMFEDGSPAGEGEVLVEDARNDLKPHMEFILESDDGTLVRGHVEQQRNGRPFFEIEDFDAIVRDAYENEPTPESQVGIVQAGLAGREVAIIGNVNSYDKSRADDGSTRTYVDIGVNGVVELHTDEPGVNPSSDEKSSENASTPPQNRSESDSPESESDGGDEDAPQTRAEEVEQKVKQYADLVGLDPDDLTVEVINEQTQIEARDALIRNVIQRMRDGGPSVAESDMADSESESDDPIERIRDPETGQLVCPHDNCIATASNEASLYGHVAGEHHLGDENPEEWVENHA